MREFVEIFRTYVDGVRQRQLIQLIFYHRHSLCYISIKLILFYLHPQASPHTRVMQPQLNQQHIHTKNKHQTDEGAS